MEEKMIVLEGLSGTTQVSEHCRKHHITRYFVAGRRNCSRILNQYSETRGVGNSLLREAVF
ncbi:MAG: hypothetical protein QXQ46_10390 [Thermoplasmatales archaeon]